MDLLWGLVIILIIMWMGGFAFHVAGGLIHLLLVVAVIVVLIRVISGRSAV